MCKCKIENCKHRTIINDHLYRPQKRQTNQKREIQRKIFKRLELLVISKERIVFNNFKGKNSI